MVTWVSFSLNVFHCVLIFIEIQISYYILLKIIMSQSIKPSLASCILGFWKAFHSDLVVVGMYTLNNEHNKKLWGNYSSHVKQKHLVGEGRRGFVLHSHMFTFVELILPLFFVFCVYISQPTLDKFQASDYRGHTLFTFISSTWHLADSWCSQIFDLCQVKTLYLGLFSNIAQITIKDL